MTNLPDRINDLERVADLYLKSYRPSEIARKLDLSPAQVKNYINDYQAIVQDRVNNDPEFLDRLAENTLEALERMDSIVSETWETYETAKDNDMINQQINLLKAAGDFEEKRAKLLQLMGAKVDGGMMARMNRAEQVNEVVSRVIKEIVVDCPRCKVEVMPRLAEAFEMMGKHEEAVQAQPFEDVESEEEGEEELDTAGIMEDVLNPNL